MAVKVENQLVTRGTVSLGRKVVKADTERLIVKDVLNYEDEFLSFQYQDRINHHLFIEPPYNPVTMVQLLTKNNVLAQCISAMEVNVAGTGFTFDKVKDDDPDVDEDKAKLVAFFDEPYPETSFVTIARDLRFDLEATGNAYLEVLRNAKGEVVFLRRLDSTTIRLVRLDEPVTVEKAIDREGVKVSAKVQMRERRYVQIMGTRFLYFKEFGASRELDRESGKWAEGKIEIEKQASEIIHMTLERDAMTSYGIPRWVNQLPSILGSRKAEEFNLEFFDNGGVPPAVVFIQGGALVNDVREQLLAYFNGASQHRVAVVEVQSTSGTIDSSGSVQVRTERFGDMVRGDSMFSNYDTSCEEHIRVGFRLPPLFVGRAQDYNFATAMTAYLVTEAQVFAPERREFDEMVNTKIVRALGIKTYKYVSNPVTLKNIEIQLKAIEMMQSKVEGKHLIEMMNELTGLSLKYSKEAEEKANQSNFPDAFAQGGDGVSGEVPAKNTEGKNSPEPKSNVVALRKAELEPEEIVGLVDSWALVMGLDASAPVPSEVKSSVLKQVEALNVSQRRLFDNVLASKSFGGNSINGLAEIAGCCADAIQ